MSMEIRELIIIEDPCFYQYTTIKELESFNTSELTIALSVLRKEQRRLKEKVYHSGSGDQVDKNNVKLINKYRANLEKLLFIKQGYIPDAITQNMIDTLIKNNKKSIQKIQKGLSLARQQKHLIKREDVKHGRKN
jgi:SET domain-containing protein